MESHSKEWKLNQSWKRVLSILSETLRVRDHSLDWQFTLKVSERKREEKSTTYDFII